MKLGNINAEIDGHWVVAHDSGELATAVTSYDITGLSGDTDVEYQLIMRAVNDSASSSYRYRLNNDTATNYGYQYITANGTEKTAARGTFNTLSSTWIAGNTIGQIEFAKIHIFAKSGKERTVISQTSEGNSGTGVSIVSKVAQVWNNTVDELTSINLFATATDGFGVGSRIILLKKVHNDAMKTGVITPNKIEGAWERIYSNTLSSAATSVTISGLTGNTDQVYRVVVRPVGGSATATNYQITMNSDTGSNYGRQVLAGYTTTVYAVRDAQAYISLNHVESNIQGHTQLNDILMYAKSGYERTALVNSLEKENGTSINTTVIAGHSWSNTADEITQIVITASQASGIGIGSVIELYRLNL